MIDVGYKNAMFTVIGPRRRIGFQTSWFCRCECGNEKWVLAANLRKISSQKSCGCLLKKQTLALIGKRFGNLVVLEMTNEVSENGDILVKCECDCGNIKNMNNKGIKNGKIVSCGCKYWKWKGHESISRDYWNRTIASAKRRKIAFEITIEQAWDQAVKQEFKCVYTGKTLIFSRHRKDRTCSLDRIDSEKGYTYDNIQWIYRPINYMKSDYSEKDFLEYIKTVYEFKGLNNG